MSVLFATVSFGDFKILQDTSVTVLDLGLATGRLLNCVDKQPALGRKHHPVAFSGLGVFFLYVCMCVCMHVRMYLIIYMNMYVCACVHVHGCVCVYVNVYVCVLSDCKSVCM